MTTTAGKRPLAERDQRLDWRAMETARLTLTPITGSDDAGARAYALTAFNIVPVVTQLSNPPYPYRDEYFDKFATALAAQNPDETIVWNVRLKQDPTHPAPDPAPVIGSIGFWLTAPGCYDLGYSLLPDHWGQGLMTEAVNAVCELAFDALDAAVVKASVYKDNAASIRVLEKSGFGIVGEGGTTSRGRNDNIAHPSWFCQIDAQGFDLHRTRNGCHSYRSIIHRQLPIVSVAAAALVNDKGQILVAQRPAGKSMAGLWEFPGGKLEPGETPEAALIRELHEELGIETDHSCLSPVAFASHSYAKFHLMMPVFAIWQWRGMVQGKEGQAVQWVDVKALSQLDMPPADAPIIPLLIDLL